jgi:diaminohydroxyphosphoribosylaminopyrimidine deaminase/5-amino-6-(5-phosphoribosylamino)uracil reductase
VNFSATDHGFMARALQLAQRGLCTTTPNPRVGCVMVRDGRVIGEGWHERAGLPHAEAVALNAIVGAGDTATGATAYVTLEPCSHFGRTPPCADALIKAGISEWRWRCRIRIRWWPGTGWRGSRPPASTSPAG